MHRRILAFDYDGTLAENGSVPPALPMVLERLRAAGHVLFLATGRRFESVALGPVLATPDIMQVRREDRIPPEPELP